MPAAEFNFQYNTTAFRNAAGSLTKAEADIHRLMREQGEEFQAELGEKIHNKIKNKQWSSGRMEAAHRAPGNLDVSPNSWRVGRVAFLDRAVRNDRGFQYWRMQEFGSSANVGRVIKLAPRSNPFQFPGFDARSSRFRSFRAGENIGQSTAVNTPRRWSPVVINNPILAQNAYEQTYREGDWARRAQLQFRQIVTRNFPFIQ